MDTKQIVAWLLVVGALNWGLVALNLNAVDMIFGAGSLLAKVVYGLIGLAGAYQVYAMVGGKKKK